MLEGSVSVEFQSLTSSRTTDTPPVIDVLRPLRLALSWGLRWPEVLFSVLAFTGTVGIFVTSIGERGGEPLVVFVRPGDVWPVVKLPVSSPLVLDLYEEVGMVSGPPPALEVKLPWGAAGSLLTRFQVRRGPPTRGTL